MPFEKLKKLFEPPKLHVRKMVLKVDLESSGFGVFVIESEGAVDMEEGGHLHLCLHGRNDLLPNDIECQFECFRGLKPPQFKLLTDLPPCVSLEVFYDDKLCPVRLVGDCEDYRPPLQ